LENETPLGEITIFDWDFRFLSNYIGNSTINSIQQLT